MTVADVQLRAITDEDREAVCALRVHPDQERFVATVPESLRDAAAAPEEHPWYRAVYCAGEPVGFVMLAEPPGGPCTLWRLLVDERHQGRGIGRAVLARVADRVRAHGATALLTSCVPGPGSPQPFYERLGFAPTGEVDDGEVVLRLPLPPG